GEDLKLLADRGSCRWFQTPDGRACPRAAPALPVTAKRSGRSTHLANWFLPRSPPSAFSNSEGFVLSRRSCDQLTQCMQLTWCHRGESESTLGWHRPASFSRKTPPYGRKTSL